MSIHKITPFLSDIKAFFKNSDMTAAMRNISSVLSHVRMTERDTLAVTSKRNCVYPLLTVFQILLLFPCFGIKNCWRCHKDGTLETLVKARKDVFYRFYGKSLHRLAQGVVAHIRAALGPYPRALRPQRSGCVFDS